MTKNISWLMRRPIAHRGLWNDHVPENSYAALERACKNGHPIECDVRLLADNTFVVFHDRNTKRMTGKDHEIESISSQSISYFTLLNTNQKIPSLKEVLDLVDGRVPLLFEMKNTAHRRRTYLNKLKEVLSQYSGEYALSSFDPLLGKEAKILFPSHSCGQNFSDHDEKGFVGAYVRQTGAYIAWSLNVFRPDFYVCYAAMLPDTWIRRAAEKHGQPLLTWAISDVEKYNEIRPYIDNYIFDGEIFM